MRARDLMPSSALLLAVTAVLALVRLTPDGTGLFLVRTGPNGLPVFFSAPAMADVKVVSIPASGLAVLYGDASRIRSVAGLALAWQGRALCFSP